jgi:hypothetical protein
MAFRSTERTPRLMQAAISLAVGRRRLTQDDSVSAFVCLLRGGVFESQDRAGLRAQSGIHCDCE